MGTWPSGISAITLFVEDLRARDTFDGSTPVRARLYEIEKSMRLDAIRRMRPLDHGHCPKP